MKKWKSMTHPKGKINQQNLPEKVFMADISNNDFKIMVLKGAWLAQSVEHMTLDFGVVGSSLTLGVEIA